VTLKARRAWPLVLVLLFANSSRAIIHSERWLLFPDLRYITSLASDPRYLYVGTRQGALRYDKLLRTWENTPGLSGNSILAPDHFSSSVYFARGSTLYSMTFFGSSSPSRVYDFGGEILAIGFEPTTLWAKVGTSYYRSLRPGVTWRSVPRDTLRRHQIQWQTEFSPDSLRNRPEYAFLSPSGILGLHHQFYPISAVAKEPMGQEAWVGTWGNGLYFYGMTTFQGQQILMGPGVDDVRAIARDGSSLWFGGYQTSPEQVAAITSYEPGPNRWEYFQPWWNVGLESALVSGIAADSQFVWFATDRGLARYEKKIQDWRTFSFSDGLPNNDITSLAYAQGRVWIGTSAGLASMIASATKAEREEDLKAVSITHLAADGQAVIAASSNGLFLKPDRDSPWRTWRSEDGVLDFNVLNVLPESAGVWVASERGLEYFNRSTRAWERHLEVPFAAPVQVYAMASDRANLWIATALGALQYDKAKKLWRIYTTLDGLPDNRVQALLLDGRYIWFGTAKGAARYQWQ
jgi:hypothetical protein